MEIMESDTGRKEIVFEFEDNVGGNGTGVEKDLIFKVPTAPTSSATIIGSEPGLDQDARVHRKVISFDGGNLKMTVTSEPKQKSSSCAGSSVMETVSIAANLFDELENVYLKRRTEIVMEDGFINTPLHVLKKTVQDFKTSMHSEMVIINHVGDGIQLWRVELFVDNYRGIGQSPRRNLSFQVAALDIIEKMRTGSKGLLMPLYAFLPGWRTGPKVFHDLKQLCYFHDLPAPDYNILPPTPFEEGPPFGVECQVGELIETVKSDDRFLAKRLAARKMYDKLSKDSYCDDAVYIGNQCMGLNELKELGIVTLTSSWKKQWLMKNRVTPDNKIFKPDNEPDDGDFEDLEETLEDPLQTPVKLPEKGKPTGLTRVVKNENIGPLTSATSDDDMDV